MRRFLLTIAVLSLTITGASADVIAEWDIANATGRTASVATTADGVDATDLSSHGLKTWNPRWGYKGLVAARNWGRHDRAIPGKYLEFSVAGDDVTYESMTFALTRGHETHRGRGRNGKRRHGAQKWALRSSVDGFSSDLFLADISQSGTDEQTVFENVDISSLGTQSGEITFRMYGFDDTANRDYAGLTNMTPGRAGVSGRGANLSVHGTVGGDLGSQPVPEPTTMALLATGALGMLLGRRRRRRD
jgi:hypothetical protein